MPDFDKNKAVTELQKEIDKIDFSGGLVPSSPTPSPEPAAPAAPESPTPEPEKPAAESAASKEPAAPESPTPEAEPEESAAPEESETPAVPDSHYRALQHEELADEFAEIYAINPKAALKMAAKSYERVNAVSQELSALGRRARELSAPPAAQPQAPVEGPKAKLAKVFKEKYEDDPMVEAALALIPDDPAPAQPRPAPQPVQQPVGPSPARSIDEEIAVRQQINTFFAADDMDSYSDLYGKTPQSGDWSGLTPGERANRFEVCDRAQLMLDGAAVIGMPLSAVEALERAHLEVAAPRVEQVVRDRIAKSVQKRAAGVTLKPSGTKTPAPAGGGYNKQQAVDDMRVELKKVFD